MPGVLLTDRMRQVEPVGASEGPPPGFLETMGASFRTAKDDIGQVQDDRLFRSYSELIVALREANGKPMSEYRPLSNFLTTSLNPWSNMTGLYDLDAVWADVEKARKANPSALAGIPKSREEFEKQILTRDGARADDQRTVSRGSGIASFVGALGAMPFDPVNIATAPLGGGAKSLGQAILREAVINAGVEAVQQVPLASARKRMGEELTLSEAATNVTVAGFFGGFLGGASKYGADNWDAIKAAPKAVQEKLWASIIDKVPALQKSLAGKMDWDALDDSLPDLAEAMIGVDNLSVNEKGALAAMRREAQIEAMNPFGVEGAGIAAHRGELAKALQRIMDDAPVTPIKARKVPNVGATGMPSPQTGTAISSGNVAGDAFSVLKSKIKVAESSGDLRAKNPNSTALGPYQFLKGTWYNYYVRRFGTGGLSRAEIYAKRTDPRLNEILMDDLMQDNAAFLRKNGHAVNPGNLYLAHFAGMDGANKVLRSDPNASVASVLGRDVVTANPFLKGWTTSQLADWAGRKMGGKGSVPSGASGDIGGAAIDPEAGVRDWIEQERAAVDAELARIDAMEGDKPDASAIVDEALANRPEPIDVPELADGAPVRPIGMVARNADAPSAEVQAILPQLREVVRARETRLDRRKEIAEALGVDESTLQDAMRALADNKEIRRRTDAKGQERFTRIPLDNRPDDILRFIARNGGLSETGLDPRFKDVEGISSGHALGKGGRDWDKYFVHGIGRLVRKSGKGLDQMGEKLWDAGYFGPPSVTPRPTESELIDAIEEAVTGRRKIFPFDDQRAQAQQAADYFEPVDMQELRDAFAVSAQKVGLDDLTDDDFWATMGHYQRAVDEGSPISMDAAFIKMLEAEPQGVMRNLHDEVDDGIYAIYEEEFRQAQIADGFVDGEDIPGFEGVSSNARPGEAGSGGSGRSDSEPKPVELEPDDFKPFDDPAEGSGAATQIQSMDHDLRALAARDEDMFGGPTQAEKRQALERKGEGGLDNGKEQKPVGGDGGLFDPASWDQMDFRMDAEGDVVNPADLLAEFDAEDAVLKTIKDCL